MKEGVCVDDFPNLRPWGSYTVLDEGKGYKVKRIDVAPGKRLSLQYHHRRQEHWTVVAGVADVLVCERGKERETGNLRLREGDHVFIPQGHVHRLGNAGGQPMALIEVQIGDYLGEDDIVRLEDDFDRTDR